jgi:hypothetical protein
VARWGHGQTVSRGSLQQVRGGGPVALLTAVRRGYVPDGPAVQPFFARFLHQSSGRRGAVAPTYPRDASLREWQLSIYFRNYNLRNAVPNGGRFPVPNALIRPLLDVSKIQTLPGTGAMGLVVLGLHQEIHPAR